MLRQRKEGCDVNRGNEEYRSGENDEIEDDALLVRRGNKMLNSCHLEWQKMNAIPNFIKNVKLPSEITFVLCYHIPW